MEIPNSNIAIHMPVLEQYAAECRVLLEMGSEKGTGSTLAFRRGMERNLKADRVWVTVDIWNQIPEVLQPAFPFWYFVLGDSRSAVTREAVLRCLAGNKPDLVFIDTDHYYGQLTAELAIWSSVVADECVWLFHDTHMNGVYNQMTDAAVEFAEMDGRWAYRQLSTECHGLGALEPRK